jgi:hypothetical protein
MRVEEHERAVGQLVRVRLVQPPSRGVDAFPVQPFVDGVCAGRSRVHGAPQREEAVVVLAPAERARAMPGGERGRLVEEEQLRELARLEERRAVPVLEPQPAGDPALAGVAPTDAARVVVQAAAVPVDEAALGRRDEVAERRDPVPKRAVRPPNASPRGRRARPATPG